MSKSFLIGLFVTTTIALGITSIVLWNKNQSKEKAFVDAKSQVDPLKLNADKWALVEKYSNEYIQEKIKKNQEHGFISDPFSDPKFANLYIKNFIKDDYKKLKEIQNGNPPTTSCWMDLRACCNLLTWLILSNGDGVRLYFAKYNEYEPVKTKPEHDRMREIKDQGVFDDRHCMVICATQLQDLDHPNEHIPLILGQTAGGVSYVEGLYNYNELCPPNTCYDHDIILPAKK